MFLLKEFPSPKLPEVSNSFLLTFISFVENAFKHGVSYRKESFVHVVMQLEEGNRLASDVPIARGLRLTSNITASVWRIYANGCGCCLVMITLSPLLRKMINLMSYLLYLYYNEMI